MDRAGYLRWQQELKTKHAEITADILREVGRDEEFIERVSFLIPKKHLRKHKESQVMEDVVCLVFLQYYFEDFTKKHLKERSWIS